MSMREDLPQAICAANDDVDPRGQQVGQALRAMDDIGRASVEISQAMAVIDSIVLQIQQLAAEAGMAAARAGPASDGFTAILGEIQSLARRSSQAADAIKATIAASPRRPGELASEAAPAIHSLAADAAAVAELMGKLRFQRPPAE